MSNQFPRIYIVHSSVTGILAGYADSVDAAKAKIDGDLNRLAASGYLLRRHGDLSGPKQGDRAADQIYTQRAEVDCDVFPDAVITYTVEEFEYVPAGVPVDAFPEGATRISLTLRDDSLPL